MTLCTQGISQRCNINKDSFESSCPMLILHLFFLSNCIGYNGTYNSGKCLWRISTGILLLFHLDMRFATYVSTVKLKSFRPVLDCSVVLWLVIITVCWYLFGILGLSLLRKSLQNKMPPVPWRGEKAYPKLGDFIHTQATPIELLQKSKAT